MATFKFQNSRTTFKFKPRPERKFWNLTTLRVDTIVLTGNPFEMHEISAHTQLKPNILA